MRLENWRETYRAQRAARRRARDMLGHAAATISYGCTGDLMREIAQDPGPMLAALTIAADVLNELEEDSWDEDAEKGRAERMEAAQEDGK